MLGHNEDCQDYKDDSATEENVVHHFARVCEHDEIPRQGVLTVRVQYQLALWYDRSVLVYFLLALDRNSDGHAFEILRRLAYSKVNVRHHEGVVTHLILLGTDPDIRIIIQSGRHESQGGSRNEVTINFHLTRPYVRPIINTDCIRLTAVLGVVKKHHKFKEEILIVLINVEIIVNQRDTISIVCIYMLRNEIEAAVLIDINWHK